MKSNGKLTSRAEVRFPSPAPFSRFAAHAAPRGSLEPVFEQAAPVRKTKQGIRPLRPCSARITESGLSMLYARVSTPPLSTRPDLPLPTGRDGHVSKYRSTTRQLPGFNGAIESLLESPLRRHMHVSDMLFDLARHVEARHCTLHPEASATRVLRV